MSSILTISLSFLNQADNVEDKEREKDGATKVTKVQI